MAFGIDPQALFRSLIPTRIGRAKPKAPRRRSSLGRGFETLETRQMMSANMGEIVGTIRLDVQNDGVATNDVLVQGAALLLYRDGGDGQFNPGIGGDTLVANSTSDGLGKYRFVGVGAGRYFVKVDLPAGMQTAAGGDVKTVTISADDADGSIGRMIDEFDSFQKVEASPPPSAAGVGSTKTDLTVLGGERDFRIEITDGNDEFSSVSLISAGGLLRLASGAMVTGDATVVWDGADGNANSINYTGLGGIDFTHDGPNTMNGIRLSVGADHPNSVVKLRIYSDATHWSEFTTVVPESAGGAIDKQAVFNFMEPNAYGAAGSADFTNVGAVELTFVGVSAVDAQISVAELVGYTTKSADFTAMSQLSVGDSVWQDANNNGLLDGAEQGIAGVKVNLYADSNGDNQYTPNVDTFVDTATTDSSGRYLFDDLTPGSFIVQVDAMNFQTGQPLAGLQSSTGKAATDPDDNIDNDDNGSALAGHGVVSQAVALLGGAEPTADGDGADSNRTIDFGFFGFDLLLDKSVDQMTVSPLEELSYDVLIVNQGPSGAKSVQFKDTLPPGVTYGSAVANKLGINFTHNNGVITASLGDMAPGEQIIITIFATVKASATGVLHNEAEVSAPDELNLLNNKDSVDTPVEPKTDLAIDKSDSQDPVAPGAQFSYTLTVTNNGPSNATGVTVLDHLPSRVTYVSSSRPNTGVQAGELRFDVGSLTAGASTTITVTVQVDPTFVGTLLNESEVFGAELETNYSNNNADEPTLVQADPASIDGVVYVDRNNNGVKESNEAPIANVVITLTGNDLTGAFLSRTTTTDASGRYRFDNLLPGTYLVFQPTQPAQFKDGIDTLGTTLNGVGQAQPPNGLVAFDQNPNDSRDADAFEGIELSSGFAAHDYNFGELAVTTSKHDLIQPFAWR